ncbi:ABC transporter permease [Corynebacterium gerontici]|uniref:Oligopeptide transport system permease protein OppC n=1 Tax=Corynebacterium gerontici TaxID=2079234 RepID=A0A3G6J6R4_9CORY|nr:ABC transporter permease [Corynebacterium gerontici]AZA12130.1 Oligopeptide transport system permease protein OppC [Corynebacterium gerontici]
MRKEYRNEGADRAEDLSPNAIPTNDVTVGSNPGNQGLISTVTESEVNSAQAGIERAHVGGARPMSKYKLYLKRFLRNKMAVVGAVIFFLLVLLAVIGPFTTRFAFDEADFTALSSPPTSDHWFGTSSSGNDLYAMVIHGLGRSLTIAVTVSVATTVISAIVGTTAALLGGRPERIILGTIHFLLVIPSFLIIALLVSGSGGDWKLLIVVLIAFGWMYAARVIWSMSISVREREYVKAARYMGVSNSKIVLRHLIPNIGSLLVINMTLGVVSAVMSETGLSFLGLGVKIPDVSLGTLLSTGANSLIASPWEFYFPAAVLTLLTVSMAFIADGLRDALDPNSAAAGKA